MAQTMGIAGVGIDWITATLPRDEADDEKWGERLHDAVAERVGRGNRLKGWSMHGYEGIISGGMGYAISDSHVMVRSSGESAMEVIWYLTPYRAKVTRLDIALDVRYNGLLNERILEHESRILRAMREAGVRERKTSKVVNSDGGMTLYVGSRSSDNMMRIYNKEIESGDSEYKGIIRYELELKGRRSQKAWRTIRDIVHGDDASRKSGLASRLISTVHAHLAPYGIDLPIVDHGEAIPLAVSKRHTDNEISLEWLRSQVRPTIKRLVKTGMMPEVIEALGLRDELIMEMIMTS